jgi:hypothetical protein
VTYSLHLVDDGFFFAKKLYHPDLSGSMRFFIFLGGGSAASDERIIFRFDVFLLFVGLSPDFSLFGFLDQVVAEIRMGDGDQLESRAFGVLRSVSLIILPRMLGIPPMPSWMQSPSFRCSRTLAAISLRPKRQGHFFRPGG